MPMDRVGEVEAKLEAVRRWLADADHAGVLIESQANFGWITAGGENHVVVSEERGVAAVLVTSGRACVLTTNIEAQRLAEEELPDGCFEVVEYPWESPDRREKLIEDLTGGATVVADLAGERPMAGSTFLELRRVLLPDEVERYRNLGEDAAMALESACRSVSRRDRELDVAAQVAQLCCEKGIVPVLNLAAADDRFDRYRHPLPTPRRVERKMMVVLVGRKGGLNSCLTRTVCFGEPEPDQITRHEACVRIDAHLISRSRPGAKLSDILAGGIARYRAEGFTDEWRNHHQGGVTGYAGREVFATPEEGYVLRANQAVAWNPSVSGAKSEDTVLVTESGHEVLTSSGHWPELEIDLEGEVIRRPGLLVR